MTDILNGSLRVNPSDRQTREARETLTHALRTATSKAKLAVNTLDLISTALRQGKVDTAGATEWLKQENLYHLLKFGPGVRDD